MRGRLIHPDIAIVLPMIRFQCPTCAKTLQVDDSLAGKTGKCSGCGQQCTIPATARPIPPPIIAPAPIVVRVAARHKKRSPAAIIAVGAIVLVAICLGLIATFRRGSGPFVISMIFVATAICLGIFIWVGKNKLKSMPPEWGPINPAMICPHCQIKGQVRTTNVVRKKGVSGSKAMAAIFTGGFSLLFTGLSQEHNQTQAHCCDCNNTWDF
jgi:hypothetical protein